MKYTLAMMQFEPTPILTTGLVLMSLIGYTTNLALEILPRTELSQAAYYNNPEPAWRNPDFKLTLIREKTTIVPTSDLQHNPWVYTKEFTGTGKYYPLGEDYSLRPLTQHQGLGRRYLLDTDLADGVWYVQKSETETTEIPANSEQWKIEGQLANKLNAPASLAIPAQTPKPPKPNRENPLPVLDRRSLGQKQRTRVAMGSKIQEISLNNTNNPTDTSPITASWDLKKADEDVSILELETHPFYPEIFWYSQTSPDTPEYKSIWIANAKTKNDQLLMRVDANTYTSWNPLTGQLGSGQGGSWWEYTVVNDLGDLLKESLNPKEIKIFKDRPMDIAWIMYHPSQPRILLVTRQAKNFYYDYWEYQTDSQKLQQLVSTIVPGELPKQPILFDAFDQGYYLNYSTTEVRQYPLPLLLGKLEATNSFD